jgi:hypothetical protein
METALILISVACEVESEKNLKRRPSWQQPIYSDDIHRFLRYVVVDAAPPGAMDVFRKAVIERFVGGAMARSAHAFSDVIRLRWSWLLDLGTENSTPIASTRA